MKIDLPNAGVDTSAATEPAPPPEPTTISPQNQGSDTVVAPVVVPEPSRPEPIDPQEVQRLQALLTEQRAIQAGLTRAQEQADKAAGDANARVEELQATLSGYEAATSGNEGAISQLQQEIDEQRQQLRDHQDNMASALEENERYKVILGEYMGDNPIAKLIQADALPSADGIDNFRVKMDALLGTMGDSAQQSMFIKMHGDRPEASPPSGGTMPTLSALDQQLAAAMSAGDWDKYNELKAQRYELLNVQGLPQDEKKLRF